MRLRSVLVAGLHRPSPRGSGRRTLTIVLALIVMPWSAVTVDASDGRRRDADFIVIVNASNPLRAMSRDRVAAYFLKRRVTWPNGTGVAPVDLPPDSRARSAFSREVLRRSPGDVSAYWVQEIFAGRSEPPQMKNSDAAVISHVSAMPGAIGYVRTVPADPGIHVLVVTP